MSVFAPRKAKAAATAHRSEPKRRVLRRSLPRAQRSVRVLHRASSGSRPKPANRTTILASCPHRSGARTDTGQRVYIRGYRLHDHTLNHRSVRLSFSFSDVKRHHYPYARREASARGNERRGRDQHGHWCPVLGLASGFVGCCERNGGDRGRRRARTGFIALPTIMLRWPASTDSNVRRLAPVALYGSILRPDAMFSIWADFVEREDDGDVFRVL